MAEVVPGVPGACPGDVRVAHAAEMRAATRSTGLTAGVIVLIALPLWGFYDWWVEPELARGFFLLRLLTCLPVLACWLLLLWDRSGERYAEVLTIGIAGLPQLLIAWMLPIVDAGFAGYLLGFSLVIYGSAFLLIGLMRTTVILIAITWAATAVSFALQPEHRDQVELATTAFYLGTASIVAGVGRYWRTVLERRELAARLALEAEQERTLTLVAELDRLSREDSLTRVANRRAWDESLGRACADAERSERPFSVLLLDIDRFKQINDEFGHRRGDEVLQEVSACLARRVRASDLLARVGGDEFAVLCPNTGPEDARMLADELILLVAAMPSDLSVSVGWAVYWPGAEPDSLMGLADQRLYDVKRARPQPPAGDAGADAQEPIAR